MDADLKAFAGFMIQQGIEKKELQAKTLGRDISSAQLALVPDGLKVLDLKSYLPSAPERKRVDLKMLEAGSFVQYVNEQKSANTRIFAQVSKAPYTFKAVIDWHGKANEAANWCEHKCTLQLDYDEKFKVWLNAHGEGLMPQADFAEFLKDNKADIAEPSGAEVLQMALKLQTTSTQRYTGELPTNAGMNIAYEDKVTTNVTIPDSIKLRTPVFAGGNSFDIVCEFKMRAQNGGVYFGIRMLEIERLIRATVKDMAEDLSVKTELPVYIVQNEAKNNNSVREEE